MVIQEKEAMRMRPWTALWAIAVIPQGGYEVIRDGRPVGIARCDDFEQAVGAILRHDLYQSWDRVVCRSGRHQREVDVEFYGQELVGT
jgi:hypothetical protein